MKYCAGKLFTVLLVGTFVCTASAVADAPAPVAATGQQDSYAAGDDGDTGIGVAWPDPRFVDNDDGTVTDRLTGLIWLRQANCFARIAWADGLALAQTLAHGVCGLSDHSAAGQWRVPHVMELFGLVDLGAHLPALAAGHPFVEVQSDFYWAGTTLDNASSPGRQVDLGYGNVDQADKAELHFVWPVRDQR